MVRIPNLNELSKFILDNVNNAVIENKEKIKIIIVKKYLFISDLFVLEFVKEILFK
tara:strand:+ start:227 stop:394 length:168 start_codon:yes stop_codon:yes gene_type:complete